MKRFLLVVLAVMLTLSLIACGGKKSEWEKYVDDYEKWVNKVAKDFEKADDEEKLELTMGLMEEMEEWVEKYEKICEKLSESEIEKFDKAMEKASEKLENVMGG